MFACIIMYLFVAGLLCLQDAESGVVRVVVIWVRPCGVLREMSSHWEHVRTHAPPSPAPHHVSTDEFLEFEHHTRTSGNWGVPPPG